MRKSQNNSQAGWASESFRQEKKKSVGKSYILIRACLSPTFRNETIIKETIEQEWQTLLNLQSEN